MKAATVGWMTGIGLVVLGLGCSKAEENVDSAYDPVGVTECDAYFKAAEACMRKNPTMKAALEPNLKQNNEVWKSSAATAQGKDALKTTCKAATASLAASCN